MCTALIHNVPKKRYAYSKSYSHSSTQQQHIDFKDSDFNSMMLKKNVLKNSDIYAIVDIQTIRKRNLAHLVSNLVHNNVSIVQLRDKKSPFNKVLKKAHLIKRIINSKTLFIINDYPELCLLVNTDGVHLGQDDLPVKVIRKVLGKNKIIGVSCHTIQQARRAQKEGADYIGFGPLFETPTKQEYRPIGINDIGKLKKLLRIPFFIIGGIDSVHLKELKPTNINRIAACRVLCQSRNIKKTIQELRIQLN